MYKKIVGLILFILLLSSSLVVLSVNIIPEVTTKIITEINYYNYLKYLVNIKYKLNNKTIEHISYIEYNVLNKSIDSFYVKVYGNFSNFSKLISLNPGTYLINPITNLLNLKYPYILPQLIYNNTYAITYANNNLIINFINITKYNNITSYKLEIISPNSTSPKTVVLLENGILGAMSFINVLNNTSYNISINLVDFNNKDLIYLNNINNIKIINNSYSYFVYNYSTTAQTLIGQGYLEVGYPFIIGNDIAVVQYRLQYIAGNKLLTPVAMGNTNVNFIITLGNSTSILLSQINNVGENKISWNGLLFKFQNITNISVFNKYYIVYLYLNKTYANITYGNESVKVYRITYAYFSKDGTLLKLLTIGSGGNLTIPIYELLYVGSKSNDFVLNPLETFPLVYNYSNTNFPYNIINPTLSLIITIVVTLIIVIIAVILRMRL
jgi:hypothetical protein